MNNAEKLRYFLAKSVSIQPRTSLPKFGKFGKNIAAKKYFRSEKFYFRETVETNGFAACCAAAVLSAAARLEALACLSR